MRYKNISTLLMVLGLWLGTGLSSLSAQDLEPSTALPDSLLRQEKPVPRLSYGLTAGAFGGTLGYGSYVAPRLNYQLTPRFQVFGSLMAVQQWGGARYYSPGNPEGLSAQFSTTPNHQLLLHAGGAYALTDKWTLSGSVWKDMSPNGAALRPMASPYSLFRSPQQGYQFQAQYKVSENVTISGGVRSGGGYGQGYYGSPAAGFHSPWGF